MYTDIKAVESQTITRALTIGTISISYTARRDFGKNSA